MLTRLIYEFLKSRPYKRTSVSYKKHKISVEIADTIAKRAVGLMYRERLEKNSGMLFKLWPPGVLAAEITMLNMRFGIDIVWLDSEKRVVSIAERVPPSKSMFDSRRPRRAAAYVLELSAGSARKLGMKLKDRVSFS
jgi:uncharacterized protein